MGYQCRWPPGGWEGDRTAAVREMAEELGLCGQPLTELFPSRIRNQIESGNISTYLCQYDDPINFCREEIEQVKFWSAAEIGAALGSGVLTPNFEEEWQMFACCLNP